MKSVSFADAITQDFWVHIAALIIVALGVVGWFAANGFKQDPPALELTFIISGLAGMGLKIVNGSAAQIRNALIAQAIATGNLPADRRQVDVVPAVVVQPAPPPGAPPAGN